MKKAKVRRVRRKPVLICDPGVCDHCLYIGEGDFICDDFPGEAYVAVMTDWEPTEKYLHCRRKKCE